MADRQTTRRPAGSNADEWHLFLCEYLCNRPNGAGNGLPFIAVQIAEAIDAAEQRGRANGPAPCIGNDPGCPCQDGDACHYVDMPGSPAMKPRATP